MKDLTAEVIKILEKLVNKNNKNKITSSSLLLEDLAFDSISYIRLIIDLEKKLNYDPIKASEEVNFSNIRTVEDVSKLVEMYPKK